MPEFDETWGAAFIERMRTHMDELHESLYGEDDREQETISGQPFCGCQDCDERERYLLATILILEGYEQGKVRLVDVPY
jgi:hypothetical protein